MSNSIPFILIIILSYMLFGCNGNFTAEGVNPKFVKITHNELSLSAPKNDKKSPEEEKILRESGLEVIAFPKGSLFGLIAAEFAGLRGKGEISKKIYIAQARKTRDPHVIARAANIANYYNNSDEMLEMAQLLLEIEPDIDISQSMYAVSLIKNQRFDEAIPHIVFSIKRSHLEPLVELLRSLAAQKDHNKLLSLLRQIEDELPNNAFLGFAKAELFFQKGLLDESLKTINKVIRDTGVSVKSSALELKAEILFLRDKKKDAYNFLDNSSLNKKIKRKLDLKFARVLLKKDPLNVDQRLTALLNQYPDDDEITFLLAVTKRMQGLDDNAIKILKKITQNPKKNNWWNYMSHLELGRLHAEKIPNQSIYHYQKFIENQHTGRLDPNSASDILRIATALESIKKLMVADNEINNLRKILLSLRVNAPKLSKISYIFEGRMLLEHKYLDEGYSLLSAAIIKYPEEIELLYMRSSFSNLLKNITKYEEDLKAILKINPDNSIVLNSLGYSMTVNGNSYEEARDLILKSLKLAPDVYETLDSLGWVYYKLGDNIQAIRYLTQALSLTTKPVPEISAHLGEVLWITGKKIKAQSVWNKILQIDSKNAIIQETLKRLKVE